MVDRCVVFLCILHCCMAIGRLQVVFIEIRLVDLPKENADTVQRVLYRARTGVKLGATGAPDGYEARALFLAWEELGPLLDYVPEDGEWQAVVAMRDLLCELYLDKPPRGDLRAAEVARTYRAHCCKDACQSNYLLYLEEKFDLPLRNYGTPIPPHAPWPNSWPPVAPRPLPLLPQRHFFFSCHGRLGNAKDVGRHVQSQQCSRGVFCLCTLTCVFRLIFAASCLIFRD